MEIEITKEQYEELIRRHNNPQSINDMPSCKSINYNIQENTYSIEV